MNPPELLPVWQQFIDSLPGDLAPEPAPSPEVKPSKTLAEIYEDIAYYKLLEIAADPQPSKRLDEDDLAMLKVLTTNAEQVFGKMLMQGPVDMNLEYILGCIEPLLKFVYILLGEIETEYYGGFDDKTDEDSGWPEGF